MISYSPAQILSNGKVRKSQSLATWPHAIVSGLDVQFVKTLSKIWFLVIAVLVFFYSIIFSMSGDVARSILEVENLNYELLSTNLELQSQKQVASSSEVIAVRAVDLGLYEPVKGQVRLYLENKNYFSYQ